MQKRVRGILRVAQDAHVGAETCDVHLRQTVLARAEKVAGSAQPQVLLGNFEAVVRALQNLQPLLRDVVIGFGKQDAVAPGPAAPDAAPELVELAQAEALRIFHDHQCRVRDVNADLDHRGRNEDVKLVLDKRAHDLFLFGGAQFAVDTADAQVRKNALLQLGSVFLCALEVHRPILALLDGGADDKDLVALRDLSADEFRDAFAHVFAHGEGVHLLAARRHLVDDRDIEIAVDDERECARDGRRGHNECVGALALPNERRALADAEAVLLIRDD